MIAGGAQFTFHLDRIPKLESYSAASSTSMYNHLNIQELWEKILLSHGRQNTFLFEPSRSKFVDRLPIIWNTQKVAKSTKLHTVSRLSSHPSKQVGAVTKCISDQRSTEAITTMQGYERSDIRLGAWVQSLIPNREGKGRLCPALSEITGCQSITEKLTIHEPGRQKKNGQQKKDTKEANVAGRSSSEIWLPIDNFPAWHMKKKELWRIERIDRRGFTHCPEMDCNFTDSQSIMKSFKFCKGKGRLRPSLSEIATRQTIQEKILYIRQWRNLTKEEQEQQKKDVVKEATSSKKQKRKTQVEENIAVSLDASTEIEVFLHTIILIQYWSNLVLLTDNASRQLEVIANRFVRHICGDSPDGNLKSINHPRSQNDGNKASA